MNLRFDEIAEIMKIIDSSSCDELIVETGDIKLVVRRNGAAGTAPASDRSMVSSITPSVAQSAPQAVGQNGFAPTTKIESSGKLEVAAPMIGTFYRAPSPGAPVFVEVGSIIRKGQPLCLIEVMKLFTTINSEFDGRIIQIGAENGELVEYGRMLFVIEPV
ncbi:acetyl-CoA carboxylase biotin carboxyl carrier protein [Bradyrhizobium sp. NP1]|uniref:acetyl-CoA carboxylase biotin carboxyl carrier protein n=1 Tax=Bradyrhizobium sp. NP1 TaxID=3049772 RepID=UPI0025A51E63|nr:acetyl-CoA carboxylase biotin carboxyl carrier protein [Bradyrhizobium sp. NP1]WJR75875.1 acetyl-CoA carboxylase biotin carboxyl carrier protein [Bradyrhizobium sp. NP1]